MDGQTTTVPDRVVTAILVAPGFAAIDMTGIHVVMSLAPSSEVHLVWKDTEPFLGVPPLPTRATTTFEQCPRDVDVLFVPAVPPQLMEDDEVLEFLADRGGRARWVAGVCGGVLVLGAAGLLRGRRATTNFQSIDVLKHFGAIATPGGVVEDANLLTSGPAVGNIEIGLRILEDIYGAEFAREMELRIEYNPTPRYGTGTPEAAGAELTARAYERSGDFWRLSAQIAERAGRRTD